VTSVCHDQLANNVCSHKTSRKMHNKLLKATCINKRTKKNDVHCWLRNNLYLLVNNTKSFVSGSKVTLFVLDFSQDQRKIETAVDWIDRMRIITYCSDELSNDTSCIYHSQKTFKNVQLGREVVEINKIWFFISNNNDVMNWWIKQRSELYLSQLDKN
jgi:hypothetical protein